MPRGDRTGPEGLGPRTGRSLGFCTGSSTPGFTKGPGRGLARGRGRGMGRGLARGFRGGRGRRYFQPRQVIKQAREEYPPKQTYFRSNSKEDEIEYLKDYAVSLKQELEDIESRIDELTNE